MHSSSTTSAAILFASLFSTTAAFVPMQIKPLPTDLDTNVWVPLTTLMPNPAPTAASPLSQVTPKPTTEEIMNILPVLDPNMVPELRKRQGVDQAIALTAVTQVSPITTYEIQLYRSGTQSQLIVVYTQTFAPIPDQWPSPTVAGTIGLGTIQGQIGVVKTKRSLPTQAPMAPIADSTPTKSAPSDSRQALLDKLFEAGKELKDEFESLVNKVKKPFIEEDDIELHTASSQNNNAFSFGEATQNDDSFSFGESTSNTDRFSFDTSVEDEDSDEETFQLLPENHAHDNDARILKSGTLAVIAVVIGTMCMSYL